MKRIKLKYFSIIFLIFIVFYFSGCNKMKVGSNSTETRTIVVNQGDTFETSAESDVSNGYAWQVSSISDDSVVGFVGSEFVAKDPNTIDSIGIQTLQFEAFSKGDVKIILEYSEVANKKVKIEKTIILKISVQ